MKQFELTLLIETDKSEEEVQALLDVLLSVADLSVKVYGTYKEDITEQEDDDG